jgi:hypothetical protein
LSRALSCRDMGSDFMFLRMRVNSVSPHGVIAQTLPASSRMQKDELKTTAAVR